MRNWLITLLFAMLLFSLGATAARAVSIKDIRIVDCQPAKNCTIVFFLSQQTPYRLFTLTKPNRVIIDLNNTQLHSNFSPALLKQTPIKAVRHAARAQQRLRIVFDMRGHYQLGPVQAMATANHRYKIVMHLVLPARALQTAAAPKKVAAIPVHLKRLPPPQALMHQETKELPQPMATMHSAKTTEVTRWYRAAIATETPARSAAIATAGTSTVKRQPNATPAPTPATIDTAGNVTSQALLHGVNHFNGFFIAPYVGLRLGTNGFMQDFNPALTLNLGGDSKETVAAGGYLGYGKVLNHSIYLGAAFGAQYRGAEQRTTFNVPGGTVTNQVAIRSSYGLSIDFLPGALILRRTLLFMRLGTEYSNYRLRVFTNSASGQGDFTSTGVDDREGRFAFRVGAGVQQLLAQHIALMINYVFSWYPTIRFTNHPTTYTIRPNRHELDAGLVFIF